MNLFYQPLLPKGVNFLEQEESRHCIKVLRKRKGDIIRVTDGQGFFYEAVIDDASADKCYFTVLEKISEPPRQSFIHIAIAPAKNPDRMEWFVEKVTELGIDCITFLKTDHTENPFLKKDRLQKVAVAAMKQSLKATLPRLTDLLSFDDVVRSASESQKFIAHVDETNPRHLKDLAAANRSIIVLIGPEGDFSAPELQHALSHGFEKVSLGKSRLRTETAGVAACHILNLVNP